MAEIETVREALKEAGRTIMTDEDLADRALQALAVDGEYIVITRVMKKRKGGVVATNSYMTAGSKGHGEFIKLRIE